MLVNGQVEKKFFMAWDFILSQRKLKKLNVGGLLMLKAEINIGVTLISTILLINEKGDFVEDLRVLITEWKGRL